MRLMDLYIRQHCDPAYNHESFTSLRYPEVIPQKGCIFPSIFPVTPNKRVLFINLVTRQAAYSAVCYRDSQNQVSIFTDYLPPYVSTAH